MIEFHIGYGLDSLRGDNFNLPLLGWFNGRSYVMLGGAMLGSAVKMDKGFL